METMSEENCEMSVNQNMKWKSSKCLMGIQPKKSKPMIAFFMMVYSAAASLVCYHSTWHPKAFDQPLCLSQFQLGTSPPPPGNPREHFFE